MALRETVFVLGVPKYMTMQERSLTHSTEVYIPKQSSFIKKYQRICHLGPVFLDHYHPTRQEGGEPIHTKPNLTFFDQSAVEFQRVCISPHIVSNVRDQESLCNLATVSSIQR